MPRVDELDTGRLMDVAKLIKRLDDRIAGDLNSDRLVILRVPWTPRPAEALDIVRGAGTEALPAQKTAQQNTPDNYTRGERGRGCDAAGLLGDGFDDAAGHKSKTARHAHFAFEVAQRLAAAALQRAMRMQQGLGLGQGTVLAAIHHGVVNAAFLLALQQCLKSSAHGIRAGAEGSRWGMRSATAFSARTLALRCWVLLRMFAAVARRNFTRLALGSRSRRILVQGCAPGCDLPRCAKANRISVCAVGTYLAVVKKFAAHRRLPPFTPS